MIAGSAMQVASMLELPGPPSRALGCMGVYSLESVSVVSSLGLAGREDGAAMSVAGCRFEVQRQKSVHLAR